MKKIIISLLFALLFCITLAFAVSAETVYLQEIPAELKTGETDTATHFIVIEEGKYFNLNGTQIRTLNADNIATDIAAAGIDASLIGTKYLTRFNFPAQIGDVTISDVYFETVKGSSTYFSGKVGYVQLAPSVIPTGNMNGSTSQLRCFDFGEGNITTTIPGYLCNGASRMKMVKNFPQNVTTVGGNAFGACNLAIFEDLKIENITSFGEYAFSGCFYAFSGELYVNANTIGSKAFDNSIANVTKLTLGPNVTSIGGQAFTVYFNEVKANSPGTIQVTEIEFQCKLSDVTINSQAFYFGGTWGRASYKNLETILLTHIDDEKNMKADSVIADFTKDGADIAFGNTTYKLSTRHDFENGKISYSSFLANGCTLCNRCDSSSSADIDPIFNFEGYSVPLNGELSLTVSYRINNQALLAYEKSTGNTVTYGLLAAVKSNVDGSPLDEEGNITSNSVLQAELPRSFSIFNIKLTNIGENDKDIPIILCGYVIEKDENDLISKIVYLEEEQHTASELVGTTYTVAASKAK